MKKRLFIVPFILIFLFTATPQPANAIFCANCKQIWQGFTDYLMDGYQLAKGTLTSISSGTTAIQQTVSTLNQTVFRPIQDAMMLMSMIKSGNMIKNLVLGGVGGETSLLIQNPERYLKQKGVESLKLSVGSVAKADGLYSDSILDAVVSQARTRSDVKGQLAALSKSSIPNTVQKNFCEDNNLSITAMKDVGDSDGNFEEDAYQARKEELYTKLCKGDPSKDKALAQALTDAQRETEIGGWEVFLAKTGGDNNFTKTQKAVALIEEERIKREAAEAADLERGNGIVSKTECLVKVKNEATGGEDCAEKSITNAGYQLSEAYKEAIQAPLKTLSNSYGTGGAFSSILGNISGIMSSINSIKSSISSVSGSMSTVMGSSVEEGGDKSLQINLAGRPSGSTNSQNGGQTTSSNSSGAQTNTASNNTTSFTQDLANNPEARKSITKPIKKQLDIHSSALSTLETSDKEYLGEINIYLGHIEAVGSCYQNIASGFPSLTLTSINDFPGATFPSMANDSRVINALSYYSERKSAMDEIKAKVNRELSLIEKTKGLVANTTNVISNSNSTEEIANTFEDYNDTVENNDLPTASSGASREGEIISLRTKTEDETRDLTGTEGGENYTGKIVKLKNECRAITLEETTKRDAAIAARAAAASAGFGGGGI